MDYMTLGVTDATARSHYPQDDSFPCEKRDDIWVEDPDYGRVTSGSHIPHNYLQAFSPEIGTWVRLNNLPVPVSSPGQPVHIEHSL